MSMLPRPRGRARPEQGAAALEFALVSIFLLPLLLGIMQYGLYFNDALQLRQGVRQAARTGVVLGSISCGTATTYGDKLVCLTKSQSAPVTGQVYVKVMAPDTTGWKNGNRLVVCAVVASAAGNAGVMPVPGRGYIKTQTQMSIEQDSPAPTGLPAADTLPTGQDWTWCGA